MFLNVDDLRLHVHCVIPKNVKNRSCLIVFLHEALGSIPQWKMFPQRLCEKLGTKGIVYERQGHGESSSFTEKRTAHYLHESASNELPAVIEKCCSKEQKVLLIGHSDGGTIALLYAAKHPHRVQGVVTMAAHVVNEAETITGIHSAVNAWHTGKLQGLYRYHGRKTEALFFAWADIWRSQEFAEWDISKDIRNESVSGLFIQGSDDQYGTQKQLDLIQDAFTHGTQVVLQDCGHHPHLEHSEQVIQIVDQWLDSLEVSLLDE